MSRVLAAVLLLLPPLGGPPSLAADEEISAAGAEAFNYIIGTQAIGGRYHFTPDTPLVESAKLIRELGSNAMKFTMSASGSFGSDKGNVPERDPSVKSLTDLAAREPSHKAVLDMPFSHYFIWIYPLGCKTSAGTFAEADHDREYREVYDLACHLLRSYSGTAKQFFLGHWEGDWHLRPHFDPNQPFPEGSGERFTAWLRVRQRAIDDAKRDTPHGKVAVWHYTEVNLVAPFLNGGQCLTNSILPQVDVDYVSYSSYDSLQRGIRDDLFAALNHIESKLRPKPGIAGKRVFIGEYGFPTRRYSANEQNWKTIQTMRAAIEWGCPFVLYWELYCNEVRDGKPGGFWLIDDHNLKQPVWFTHRRFLAEARRWVSERTKRDGTPPSEADYRQQALRILDGMAGPGRDGAR
jgi:hypothetical protein